MTQYVNSNTVLYIHKDKENKNIKESLEERRKSEVKNMDNLTAQKKLKLISDCVALADSVGKLHIDIRKMYSYLVIQAVNAETSSDIKAIETVKVSLDFLVKAVLK